MSWDSIFASRKEEEDIDEFVKTSYENYLKDLRNSKLLDLGCGTGRNSFFFADKSFKVYALDKSKLALNILNENIKGEQEIKTVQSEIDKIPYPNDFFDVVISTLVLHHGKIEQIRKWFDEIKRVLKKNGFLVISILSKNDFRSKTGKEIEPGTRIGISNTFDTEIPHHFFTKKELTNLLNNLGFVILKINETERRAAKGYKKFKHWDVIALLK